MTSHEFYVHSHEQSLYMRPLVYPLSECQERNMEAYFFSEKDILGKIWPHCYQVLDAHIFALKVLYVQRTLYSRFLFQQICIDSRQTHKWEHFCHCYRKALGTVFFVILHKRIY